MFQQLLNTKQQNLIYSWHTWPNNLLCYIQCLYLLFSVKFMNTCCIKLYDLCSHLSTLIVYFTSYCAECSSQCIWQLLHSSVTTLLATLQQQLHATSCYIWSSVVLLVYVYWSRSWALQKRLSSLKMLVQYLLSFIVCLSVCHNSGVLPKQLNIGSCKERYTVAHGGWIKRQLLKSF